MRRIGSCTGLMLAVVVGLWGCSTPHRADEKPGTGKQPVQTPRSSTPHVSFRVFSLDGKTVLSPVEGAVRIIDVISGNPSKTLPMPAEYRAIAPEVPVWSPTDRFVLAHAGNFLFVWDVTAETPSPKLMRSGPIATAVFSPDGKKVLVAGGEGGLQLWDMEAGRKVFSSPQTENAPPQVTSMASYSPDGAQWLVVQQGVVRVYNATTFQPEREIALPATKQGVLTFAAISASGKELVATGLLKSGAGWIGLFDLGQGQWTWQKEAPGRGDRDMTLAFSVPGDRLFVAGPGNGFEIVELSRKNGEILGTWKVDGTTVELGGIPNLSSDEKWLSLAWMGYPERYQPLFDATKAGNTPRLFFSAPTIYLSAAWSSDGTSLAVLSNHGSIWAGTVQSGGSLRPVVSDNPLYINRIRWAGQKDTLWGFEPTRGVHRFQWGSAGETQRIEMPYPTGTATDSPVYDVFQKSCLVNVREAGDGVVVWQPGEVLAHSMAIPGFSKASSSALAPDCRTLAVLVQTEPPAGAKKRPVPKINLQIWDVVSGKRLRAVVAPRGVLSVFGVELMFSSDGKMLVGDNEAGRIVWNVNTLRVVRPAPGVKKSLPPSQLVTVAADAEGEYLLLQDVSNGQSLRLRPGLVPGEKEARLSGWGPVVLSPDGTKMALVGERHVFVLDARTGETLWSMGGPSGSPPPPAPRAEQIAAEKKPATDKTAKPGKTRTQGKGTRK